MQEKLNLFETNKVWSLVPPPKGKPIIGIQSIFRNKMDENDTVIRNKARLAAKGYIQEEIIDYDDTFAHVARLEAIRIFLAYATYMNIKIKQSDKGFSINQERYITELLKKHDNSECSSVKTPVVTLNNVDPDIIRKSVDETQYRGTIRSLMYLIANRPDIQFST
ncbi:retrovirus-related pol polyprotein from transposon TNT 1-94 [Tanacetum coccineum]